MSKKSHILLFLITSFSMQLVGSEPQPTTLADFRSTVEGEPEYKCDIAQGHDFAEEHAKHGLRVKGHGILHSLIHRTTYHALEPAEKRQARLAEEHKREQIWQARLEQIKKCNKKKEIFEQEVAKAANNEQILGSTEYQTCAKQCQQEYNAHSFLNRFIGNTNIYACMAKCYKQKHPELEKN